jgi:hypothetical protein
MKRTALGPLVGLAISGLVVSAFAQAPSSSARHGKPFGAPPGGSAGPHGKPGHAHDAAAAAPSGSVAPAASGHPGGPPDRPALHQKMMERMATFKARREAHVGELRSRFSELHLKNEALRNELRRHARSVAFLTRARLVAEAELTEPKKAKVLKRIDVLLAKEAARHDRHVAKFTSTGPSASGSAPPFASGVVPLPVVSGSAGRGPAIPKPKRSPDPAASAGGSR